MKSRGRSRSRYKEPKYRETFPLTERLSTRVGQDDESGDDIHPDSDASLLRRHRSYDDEEDEEEDDIKSTVTNRSVIQRFISFMSRSPLLGGSTSAQGTASYGALPELSPRTSQRTSQSDAWRVGNSKQNAKSRAIRPTASFASFGTRRRRESTSHSRTRFRRASMRASSPMLIAEPGHPAGLGGQLGGGLPLTTSEDEEEVDEEAISIDEVDANDPSDNSPYAQVRASVAATDDTSASINTPRMWILSLLCALLGSATNLFFSLRYPSVAITPVIALVVVHPLGRLWDRLLKHSDDPTESFENGNLVRRTRSGRNPNPSTRARLRLWLAQGTWNGKEHACVYISSNVSFGFAFATDVIVEQSKFYHQNPSVTYQLLLTISTQILGYSFAGLTRRYLVRPPSMIWPGTLMSTAMFTTMHSSENKSANGWIISRWKFFLFAWSGAFAWYFLPGLLMPALSYFNVITWFAPNNVVIANLVSFLSKMCEPSLSSYSSGSLRAWVSFQ